MTKRALAALGVEPGCYTRTLERSVAACINICESLSLDYAWAKLVAARWSFGVRGDKGAPWSQGIRERALPGPQGLAKASRSLVRWGTKKKVPKGSGHVH